MKEKAYQALVNMGYSPEEARETVDTASPEDLALLVPAEKPKPIARAEPVAKAKPVARSKPVVTAKPQVETKPKAFDPVAAAMGIVEKVEERPTVRYMVRPLFKLKLIDETDSATFKGIKEEMESNGGYWFEPLKCFVFEKDPSELF